MWYVRLSTKSHLRPSASTGPSPRVRGTPNPGAAMTAEKGPSQRVRGNRASAYVVLDPPRSILARAGKPSRRPSRFRTPRVHPRACGGTCVRIDKADLDEGPSSRVRGNPGRKGPGCGGFGSILARAGEPNTSPPGTLGTWVHPRACGGTALLPVRGVGRRGPSSRVRGNRGSGHPAHLRQRSILARAGEPLCRPEPSQSPHT